MLHAIVHAADIQHREGGVMLMASLFGLYPFLLKLLWLVDRARIDASELSRAVVNIHLVYAREA